MKKLSLPLLTLYADVQQQLQTTVALPGSVYEQDVKGRPYLRAAVNVGAGRRMMHLGPADDPEAKAAAERIRAEMRLSRERRRIVRTLREAGFGNPGPDLGAVLEAVAAAGLFQAGAVLVGTGAYQCMSALVGAALPASAMTTQDADIATATLTLTANAVELTSDEPEPPVRRGKKGRPALLEILRWADRSFDPIPDLNPRALPARYRSASGFVVDVLAPRLRRSDPSPIGIPELNAGGLLLQHLDWLIAETQDAVALHGSGILVRVPVPARYAVHKLIIAQKRLSGDGSKRFKDLEQARAMIEVLRDRDRFALADALEDARGRGDKGWAAPIDNSLAELGVKIDDLL
ncbi:hypothetical protein GCM10007036_12400 [Alsobacter metallidurans]|uniref:Nucleotidyltransferase-like domain-containing protein n=1 Tax=Alsobacter metallidurans TaxID=340221 RepID=A0A917I4F9_9HYPH|nr:GSU2403 family nucleotidyltransferase fold protein [Alsobacter metallidurans]GGH13648.1 hypothetical protein GCM10007036_12400 [Alsobacter metallidurans]